MNSELIVMVFSDQNEAFEASLALAKRPDSYALGLEDIIIVTKDYDDNVEIHQRRKQQLVSHEAKKQVLDRFAEAVLLGNGDHKKKLSELGLDNVFLEETRTAFAHGCSAFFLYISATALIDKQRLLRALAPFAGTILRTTFPEESIGAGLSLRE